MRAIFHQRVYADLAEIIEQAIEQPTTFAVRERDIRRADLRRFPYHFLFRIVGDSVRIVRHQRTMPSLPGRSNPLPQLPR